MRDAYIISYKIYYEVTFMKNNENYEIYENQKEELNYKHAYNYLFNKVTEIIKLLAVVQLKAEEICIDDAPCDDIEIDTDEILKNIINKIRDVSGVEEE